MSLLVVAAVARMLTSAIFSGAKMIALVTTLSWLCFVATVSVIGEA